MCRTEEFHWSACKRRGIREEGLAPIVCTVRETCTSSALSLYFCSSLKKSFLFENLLCFLRRGGIKRHLSVLPWSVSVSLSKVWCRSGVLQIWQTLGKWGEEAIGQQEGHIAATNSVAPPGGREFRWNCWSCGEVHKEEGRKGLRGPWDKLRLLQCRWHSNL